MLFRRRLHIGTFLYVCVHFHCIVEPVVRSQNIFDNCLVFPSPCDEYVVNLLKRGAVARLYAGKHIFQNLPQYFQIGFIQQRFRDIKTLNHLIDGVCLDLSGNACHRVMVGQELFHKHGQKAAGRVFGHGGNG